MRPVTTDILTSRDVGAIEVRAPDGARIVSAAVNLCLYIEEPLEEIADAVLSVFEAFLDVCPCDRLAWYLTNSMEKHEKVTARTFGIPRTWLLSEKKSKQLMTYEIKDAASKYHSDTANWKFRFISRSRNNSLFPERANTIEVVFPCEYGDDLLNVFVAFVENACDQLPFLSGHAGFTLEVSRYYENRGAYDQALALGMRYKELDISEPEFARVVKEQNGLKGINWMTILGRNIAKRVPAQERTRQGSLLFKEVTGGLIVQAGNRPAVADGNRAKVVASYRESYGLLRRLIVSKPFPLRLTGGFQLRVERTRKWIHRFARK